MAVKPYVNRRLIRVSLGLEPAEVVITGGQLLNVFTLEVMPADVAIAEGRVAVVGRVEQCVGPDTQVYDTSGYYLVPGLIDPHIHPEVTKLTLTRFAEAVLARGTTSIMCSLDQIGVVSGLPGMRWVLDEIGQTPLKAFYCSPSRLPYTTPASTVAYAFGSAEHQEAMGWDETVGIWEYMIDSIAALEEPVLAAASRLIDAGHRPQGHLPFASGPLLAAAGAAGAATDHESWFADQVAEKLRAGLYVLLRKASCVDNIAEGLRAVTHMGLPTRRVSFCADDIDCTDLTELGHVDHYVRYAIQLGLDAPRAIQMATLTAAEAGRIDHLVGAIAPGRIADLLLVKDLREFSVHRVFANGQLVAQDGQLCTPLPSPVYPASFFGTMRLDRPISEEQLYVRLPASARQGRVVVMHLEASQLRSRRQATLPVESGNVLPDPEQDVAYISVTDRHSGQGKTSAAFISGFGLRRGAFASSLSPDDNNIICIGASVPDMAAAIRHLFEIGGGQAVVADGQVVADIPLPVCGIMADLPANEVAEKERHMERVLKDLGVTRPKPFFSMLFLSITAIPELAVTDQGLVDASTRQVIDPVVSWS